MSQNGIAKRSTVADSHVYIHYIYIVFVLFMMSIELEKDCAFYFPTLEHLKDLRGGTDLTKI